MQWQQQIGIGVDAVVVIVAVVFIGTKLYCLQTLDMRGDCETED
jgi:hypothetical protein